MKSKNQKLKSDYITAIREVLEDLSTEDERDGCYILSIDKEIYDRFLELSYKALKANITWRK